METKKEQLLEQLKQQGTHSIKLGGSVNYGFVKVAKFLL